MIDGFVLLTKDGKCLLRRQCDFTYLVGSVVLDTERLMAFHTSATVFASALMNQRISSFVFENSYLHFMNLTSEILAVVHTASPTNASAFAQKILRFMQDMLVFFFGPVDKWDDDMLVLSGFEDLIDSVLRRMEHDYSIILGGVEQIPLDGHTRNQIDRWLASLEDIEEVRGSLMFVNKTILHSRLPSVASQMIVHYVKTRPLVSERARITPVYLEGHWYNLSLISMREFILALVCDLRTTYSRVEAAVEGLETSLHDSEMDLPSQEPMFHVRQYAPREVLGFAHLNLRTKTVTAPPLRLPTEMEQKHVLQLFWWFYVDVCQAITYNGLSEIVLIRDNYRFHYKIDRGNEIMVVFSDQAEFSVLASYAQDIIKRLGTLS